MPRARAFRSGSIGWRCIGPRQWGACGLACHLYGQLELDRFWEARLVDSREGTRWRHALKVGEALRNCAATRPETAAAIVVTLDSIFIQSCEDGERHLEVRVGNVETKSGGRQVFGAVAKADTDITGLIRRSLDAVGHTEGTALTAFTDGCPGLRRILADAGVTTLPILNWFHIAMRLQHLKQIAGGLSADDPQRAAAKAVIVAEVERLHSRLWNGKAKNAQISIDHIRAVMHHFQGEPGERKSTAPFRKLWTALQALDGYLTGQCD
jgi:hypothetical protein